jgi:hypothetical protein
MRTLSEDEVTGAEAEEVAREFADPTWGVQPIRWVTREELERMYPPRDETEPPSTYCCQSRPNDN